MLEQKSKNVSFDELGNSFTMITEFSTSAIPFDGFILAWNNANRMSNIDYVLLFKLICGSMNKQNEWKIIYYHIIHADRIEWFCIEFCIR